MSVGQWIISLHFCKQLSEKNIAEMKEESWDESESSWIKFHTLEDMWSCSIYFAVEQGK